MDIMPTKLAKLVPGTLAEPLSIAIKNSINTSTFQNNARIVPVVNIDEETDDTYVIFNFRPVSILNCFKRVYENVIKSKLVKFVNVHHYLYEHIERVTRRCKS